MWNVVINKCVSPNIVGVDQVLCVEFSGNADKTVKITGFWGRTPCVRVDK
jgi:hypothetical protein